MTYRIIMTLLLCLMLPACVGKPPLPAAPDEEPLALPERFLGTWVYSPYNKIQVIRPHGQITVYYTQDKDIDLSPEGVYDTIELNDIETENRIYTENYRVIYVESPYSVYLLHRNNEQKPSFRNYRYVHMIIHPEDYIYKDRPEYLYKPPAIGWTYGCNTTEEDWTKPRTVLRARLLGSNPDDCTITRLEEHDWPHRTYWRGSGLKNNDDK